MAQNFRFGVIVSRWNEVITKNLLEGTLQTLKSHDVSEDRIEVMKIPGCFEMPIAAKQMAERRTFDALICLGAVIRGETTHHQYIASEAASGIRQVSLEYNIPIGFGILTTENEEQALERAGGKGGNKGTEAALAALEMTSLFKIFRKDL